MAPLSGPAWVQRLLALLLVVAGVPAVLSGAALLREAPITVGQPSPRTVVAPELIRVEDEDATERARRQAANTVEPVLTLDREAQAAIVQEVRDFFSLVSEVRQPGESGQVPSTADQVAALLDNVEVLGEQGLQALVELSDGQLADVAEQTVQIAQQIARMRIAEDDLDEVVDTQLTNELIVRSLPPGIAETVVEPLIRTAARPTVLIDQAATAAAREQAAEEVTAVAETFPAGDIIVSAGEVVDEVEFAALRSRGLEGAEPVDTALRATALMLVVTAAIAYYLRTYRHRIWRSRRRCLLLSLLFLAFVVLLQVTDLFTPSAIWLNLIPVGAVAMLVTILFDPPVGVLMTIPVTAIVAFTAPGQPGVIAFAAIASLASVPLVSRLSARGDLRRAAGQATLAYGLLAAVLTGVFGDPSQILVAALIGVLNGVVSAVIVNGSLPFLESVFGIVTATSLLDLADRNHPLLRELEQKALGSYNHSIMVSTMVERAARAIGADGLLGSVAALYHDIGKVRRPYFFVENQFGVANPHDELAPEISAEIIQKHVSDGIEMARTSRLPPEVVEGIATHHGTTLVSYFYMAALNRCPGGQEIDEEVFRYKGRKPSTKEMAILMMADCCEGASRAAAQNNRNLSREDLERIVYQLLEERVDDGQLDDANLTFRELNTVRDSFIDTLVGVYHPRIAYPDRKKAKAASRGSQAEPVPASAHRGDGADNT